MGGFWLGASTALENEGTLAQGKRCTCKPATPAVGGAISATVVHIWQAAQLWQGLPSNDLFSSSASGLVSAW